MQAQFFIVCLFGLFLSVNGCFPPPPTSGGNTLPTVSTIDPNSITLGGFSSGASLSTQVPNPFFLTQPTFASIV